MLQTIEKYQIIKKLGDGSFGEVYHVRDRALNIDKAIKVLKTTNPNSFMRSLEEAQILVRCSHKHIVSINEANIFPVNGQRRVILDLEYMEEGSIEDAINNRWISLKESIISIRGALFGLEYAHNQGFLHRDVKPGNILLSSTGPKLSDFGLATDAGSKLIGSAKGYRPHLPPEYYKTGQTTVLTDVFATGVTLYRSLQNIKDWRSIIHSIPNLNKHYLSGTLINKIGFSDFLPKRIIRITKKACHPDPTRRYQSALSFRKQLDSIKFGIDWILIGEYSWQGHEGKMIHVCYIDKRNNEVITKKNNRKIGKYCKRFSNLEQAIEYMSIHIANTCIL